MSRVLALSLALVLLRLLLLVTTATVEDDSDLDVLLDNLFPLTTLVPDVGSQDSCHQGQRCVPKYRCTNETTSGEGLIDIRFSESNPCVDYLLKCCYEEDIIAEMPTTVSSTTSVDHPVCGRRNSRGIGFRITGAQNNESEYGEFPWMVAISRHVRVLDKEAYGYLCGGSLIHPSVVLTAVHCVQKLTSDQLRIRAGEWDTQTTNEIHDHQDRKVAEIVAHPDYHKGGLFNDIALLVLETPVVLNEAIQTVCLPPPDSVFDHQRCFVSGWGKDAYGKAGVYQAILKKIDLPIIPRNECQTALRTIRSQPGFTLHESLVCAEGEVGKSACQGDGGSPLVCPIPDTDGLYHQVGIVAWGIGCGMAAPGLYADVSHLRNWIDQEMQNRDLDTGSYSIS